MSRGTPPGHLPESVRLWRERGEMLRLAERELFVVDTGDPPAPAAGKRGGPVLALHGFPTSSHDWHRVLPHLSGRRLILPDLPGYGLSEKPEDYSYSLLEQAELVELLLREKGLEAVHVISHDMGTSVACELCARRERGLLGFRMRSLLLMNGSVHLELAKVTPSQKLLRSPVSGLFVRVASKAVFRWQLGRILGRPLADEDYDAMWAQLEHRGGKARMPRAISYLDERERFRHRWIGALERLDDLPVLVLWGPEDGVAILPIAHALTAEIPGARLRLLDGLGHYPQLEDPEATGTAIREWLEEVEA